MINALNNFGSCPLWLFSDQWLWTVVPVHPAEACRWNALVFLQTSLLGPQNSGPAFWGFLKGGICGNLRLLWLSLFECHVHCWVYLWCFFCFWAWSCVCSGLRTLPPIHTAQPHCIATIPRSCLIVVIHCMSWWHCISNWLCPCANPSIGLTLEQQPHLSPGALPLCTISSTAQCDHAHAVHTALREFAEIVRKIAGYPSTAPAKGAESRGNWRKLAESGGKWRKVAEIHGKSRKLAERGRTTNLFFGIHMAVCTDTPCFCTSGVFHFCRRLCCTWARQTCK